MHDWLTFLGCFSPTIQLSVVLFCFYRQWRKCIKKGKRIIKKPIQRALWHKSIIPQNKCKFVSCDWIHKNCHIFISVSRWNWWNKREVSKYTHQIIFLLTRNESRGDRKLIFIHHPNNSNHTKIRIVSPTLGPSPLIIFFPSSFDFKLLKLLCIQFTCILLKQIGPKWQEVWNI